MTYESPVVEVISVEVEKGYAASTTIGGGIDSEGMEGGGDVEVDW